MCLIFLFLITSTHALDQFLVCSSNRPSFNSSTLYSSHLVYLERGVAAEMKCGIRTNNSETDLFIQTNLVGNHSILPTMIDDYGTQSFVYKVVTYSTPRDNFYAFMDNSRTVEC